MQFLGACSYLHERKNPSGQLLANTSIWILVNVDLEWAKNESF